MMNYADPRLSSYSMQTGQFRTMESLLPKIDPDKDRQIIDSWLLERGKFQLNPTYIPPKKPNEVTLNLAKRQLKTCLEIIEKLNKTQEELRSEVETMSSVEWKLRTVEIGNLRDEFDKSMLIFEDNVNVCTLKAMVKKRTRKRANQKRRKRLRSELLKEEKEKRLELHKNIDRWLESKKEEVERTKMDEKLKKDADCVLYEVTKKKSEARKQLSLISALVKLRTVRDAMASQRGEKPSLEDRKAFGAVTEKLIRMWENSFQNYTKEEQCLQVMLEHNASEDTKAARQAKESQVVDKWEAAIFGEKTTGHLQNPTYWALTSAERDMETFVAIRKSWDTFLTNPCNSHGSGIPIGWVLPPEVPHGSWTKFLSK